MSSIVNDFASWFFAPRRPASRTRQKYGRAAVLCLLGGSIVLASGCSHVPFLSESDPRKTAVDGRGASPEQISVALDFTREQMRMAPDEPYWAFRMGELYAAADSSGMAIANLQRALEIDTAYAPAVALLSKLYYEAGTYEEAADMLERFLSSNPNAPDALRAALALHLEAIGDVEGAQAALAACSDNSKEVRETRTFVSLRDDDLEAALASAKQALDDNPRSAANHNNYGIALLWSGRPVEASKAFKTALRMDKKLPGALYNMAIVEAFYFFDEEEGRKWFTRYKKYANEDPDNLEAVFGTDLTKRLGDAD